ncbi:hypothetical protein JCM15519_14800 [Fundidesulfovibrio butyratiphilus]
MSGKKVWGVIIILLSLAMFGFSGYNGYQSAKDIVHFSEADIREIESSRLGIDGAKSFVEFATRDNAQHYKEVAVYGILLICSVIGAVVGTKMLDAKDEVAV